MISKAEDAVICDFAEYYHIYDYRSLPVAYAATLACGLREDSRTFIAINGTKHGFEMMYKTLVLDYLARLWWAQTEDGHKNQNAPESIYKMVFGDDKPKNIQGFKSGKDFMERWNSLTKNEGA